MEWCIHSDTQLKAAGNFMFIIFASHICADPETWNLLQLRFQHNCRSGILEDIYDGREYVKHKDFLGQPLAGIYHSTMNILIPIL